MDLYGIRAEMVETVRYALEYLYDGADSPADSFEAEVWEAREQITRDRLIYTHDIIRTWESLGMPEPEEDIVAPDASITNRMVAGIAQFISENVSDDDILGDAFNEFLENVISDYPDDIRDDVDSQVWDDAWEKILEFKENRSNGIF